MFIILFSIEYTVPSICEFFPRCSQDDCRSQIILHQVQTVQSHSGGHSPTASLTHRWHEGRQASDLTKNTFSETGLQPGMIMLEIWTKFRKPQSSSKSWMKVTHVVGQGYLDILLERNAPG